ncbi:MAG: agmatinase [Candidatus Heimdallarchaeota archaeon]
MGSQDLNPQPFFGATTSEVQEANLAVLGIPWDASSSFQIGAALAPQYIRTATSGQLYNPYTEDLVNLKEKWKIYDWGDVHVPDDVQEAKDYLVKIHATLKTVLQENTDINFLFLGGDHLSTYFSLTSLYELGIFHNSGLIYLDAHPDLYLEYEASPYSHACVVRRLIEEIQVDPKNIFQVGIRAATPSQANFAKKMGITTISAREFQQLGADAVAKIIGNLLTNAVDSIYLSIDLDVLDPSCAPGVPNPEPGGLLTRDLVTFIQTLPKTPVRAFDVVELLPAKDITGITGFAAAKIIRETLGKIDPFSSISED